MLLNLLVYAGLTALISFGVYLTLQEYREHSLIKPIHRALTRTSRKISPVWVVGIILTAVIAAMIGSLVGIIGLGLFTQNLDVTGIPAFYATNWHLPLVREWFWTGFAGAFVVCAIGAFAIAYKPTKLHGEARWARPIEIKRAGLRAKTGIVIGKVNNQPVRLGGTEHVIVEAPTRAGKGVGIVIPNLLEWTESTVVLDVKQENWDATAGYRKDVLGQEVLLFNPLSVRGDTVRYNPLGHIDRTDDIEVIDQLQKIGVMLYPEPKDGESFWLDSARSAFIGVGAYIAAHRELPFTIGEVYRQITQPNAKQLFEKEVKESGGSGITLSEACRGAIADYTSSSDNTYSSIRQTVTSRINLWINPHVDAATSASDFELENLRKGVETIDRAGNKTRVPLSLYLGVSPDDIERVQPLYNLMCQQIIDRNVQAVFGKDGNTIKVLLVLDEFARLGRSAILAHSFSYVAGYGLRMLPVIQSRSQLRAIYGKDTAKEIMTNCGVEVIFGVKEDDVSAELERRLGYYTFGAKSRSRKTWESFDGSVSQSDQRRALMMAQEIRGMSPDKALIFRAATPPILATKIKYYEDAAYDSKAGKAPPDKSGGRTPPSGKADGPHGTPAAGGDLTGEPAQKPVPMATGPDRSKGALEEEKPGTAPKESAVIIGDFRSN